MHHDRALQRVVSWSGRARSAAASGRACRHNNRRPGTRPRDEAFESGSFEKRFSQPVCAGSDPLPCATSNDCALAARQIDEVEARLRRRRGEVGDRDPVALHPAAVPVERGQRAAAAVRDAPPWNWSPATRRAVGIGALRHDVQPRAWSAARRRTPRRAPPAGRPAPGRSSPPHADRAPRSEVAHRCPFAKFPTARTRRI